MQFHVTDTPNLNSEFEANEFYMLSIAGLLEKGEREREMGIQLRHSVQAGSSSLACASRSVARRLPNIAKKIGNIAKTKCRSTCGAPRNVL